jgi:quinol-cytochrome oxidoreductase complex cytochrome b subunit
MKLPSPPRALRRSPPRPGEDDRKNGRDGRNGRNGAPTKTKPTAKDHAVEGVAGVVGWLDERTGASPFLRGFLYRKVPKGTNWYYTLGSATMFAFLSQAVTGVFLAMYYEPDPTRAYESASRITNEIFLGEFVRGMHKWGSSVMIILIFVHMARTFFFGAYKYPRELNWVIGVVLIVLTLLMGLTGYLLPFDQRSFWATVVAVNINASGPLVGPYLADFLRVGSEFGPTTISRFYALHMLLVPGLIAALIGAHLYLVAKLGTTAPPWLRAEKKDLLREEV